MPAKVRPADADAVGALGEGVELLEQRVEHHAQRQVQHAEEDVAVAHHEQADDQAEQPGQQRAERQQQQGFRHRRRDEGDDIGADREEHAMAEADLPGAQQQQDAEHRDALGQRHGEDEFQPGRQEGDRIRAAAPRTASTASGTRMVRGAGAESAIGGAHTRRVSSTPNSPCGRTSSTATMMM